MLDDMACIIPQRVLNPRYKKFIRDFEATKYDDLTRIAVRNLKRELRKGIPLADCEYRDYATFIFSDSIENYAHNDDFYIDIPCGRCVNCLKHQNTSWRTRLLIEFEYMSSEQRANSYFVTLTISPEYYSAISADPSPYIRKFLDRCRKLSGQSPRHYIITEFGENTGRLHFHCLFFDLPFDPIHFEKLWKYGYIAYSNMTQRRISYAVSYITKDLDELIVSPEYKPRRFVSKGLGSAYASDAYNQMWHRKDGQPIPIMLNDQAMLQALPRYLRDKVFTPEELEELRLSYYANKDDDVIPDPPYRIGGITYTDYTLFLKDARKVLATFIDIYRKPQKPSILKSISNEL